MYLATLLIWKRETISGILGRILKFDGRNIKEEEVLKFIVVTHFSPVLHLYKNQSFDLPYKSIDWFLYEMWHWAEIS